MRIPLVILLVVFLVGGVWHLQNSKKEEAVPAAPAAVTKLPEVVQKLPVPVVDEPALTVELTTGRVLYDVMAVSYSASAVSVTHRDGKQIIPYEQFPASLRDALMAKKPATKAPDPKEEARRTAAANEKARKKAEQERQNLEAERKSLREADRTGQKEEFGLYIHERVAKSHAYNFFNSKYDPTGSGTGYITDLSVVTNGAEQMSGWEGRYRVTGTASFRLYESAGRSMNQGSRSFEVTTEQKGNNCRVIDFSVK